MLSNATYMVSPPSGMIATVVMVRPPRKGYATFSWVFTGSRWVRPNVRSFRKV